MNRNHLWKFLLIILVVLWSVYEMYPPSGINLIHYFQTQAVQRDATFTNIVHKAEALEKARPEQTYANLKEAIGTNDITHYFRFPQAKDQLDPNTYVLNQLQRDSSGRIHLGLDLQGGTSFVMQMDTNKLENTTANSALSQAVDVLRKRVDRFGVAEPVIQPEGNDRIVIQLPGLSAAAMEDARTTLQKPAFLEFKLVDTNPEDVKLMTESHVAPPGYVIMREANRKPGDKGPPQEYLVQQRPLMTGGIKSAMVTRGNLGQPEISFTLESSAASKFGHITTEYQGKLMAIILDGELQTAPRIQTPILDGSGQITGDYTEQQAFNLANVLRESPPGAAENHQLQRSGSDAGKDSIHSGIKASIIGIILVAGVHAGLLFAGRSGRQYRPAAKHRHSAGRDVLHRHDADSAGHCGCGVDHRHGGGRQRADLRTHPRGNGRRQIHARRALRRLRQGVRHDFRLEPDDVDFVGHSDFHGHRAGQRLRRDADHRCGGQLVHRAGGDAADLRLVAREESPEIAADAAHHSRRQN